MRPISNVQFYQKVENLIDNRLDQYISNYEIALLHEFKRLLYRYDDLVIVPDYE